MIRLIASDIDGTIMDSERPTEYILECIDKIIDSGCYFALATGRSLHNNVIEAMGLKGKDIYYLANNGCSIKDKDLNVINEEYIDKKFLSEFIEAFPHVTVEYLTVNKIYCRQSKDYYVKFRYSDPTDSWLVNLDTYLANMVFDCSPQDILKEKIIKINIRYLNGEIRYLEDVKAFIKKNEHIIQDKPYTYAWSEISSIKADKASAIRQLAKILNVEEDEIAVFGDGGNDVSMLKAFKHSYAPKNAVEEAKSAANEVVAACEQFGPLLKMLELVKK